jgi:hypothetical protein
MNIEDLIILLATRCQLNQFDYKIVESFYDQISQGNGFTDKQSALALKILERQSAKLSAVLSKDITEYLENPVFRLKKRSINMGKKITVIDHNDFGKAIKVEFPYNETLVEKIRRERINLPYAAWDRDERAWIFSLNERSIQLLLPFVLNEGFIPDDEFANYIEQIKTIQENLEKYVPMVTFHENTAKFINVSNNVPQPNTDNILESLFLARKTGIHTWDDTISEYLEKENVNKTVINFLNGNPGTTFSINLEDFEFSDLTDIVKHLGPCAFIVPGGSELEKTQASVEFLNSVGIANNEISVLFRLPKETGEKFNIFVKDAQLNNPITDKTRAVFISSKVPKTIIDANIKFNCVVNFNFYSVHYTIREFVKNHQNVIHVLEKKSQRNLNFAFL